MHAHGIHNVYHIDSVEKHASVPAFHDFVLLALVPTAGECQQTLARADVLPCNQRSRYQYNTINSFR